MYYSIHFIKLNPTGQSNEIISNPRQERKAKYFQPCPNIHINNSLQTIKKGVLLKNGLRCSPVKQENIRLAKQKSTTLTIQLQNTCPFDSIAQLLLTTALDWTNFEIHIKNSDIEMLKFISTFMKNGTNKNTLQKRAQLLRSIYPLQTTFRIQNISSMVKIDAWDDISSLWTKLMSLQPTLLRLKECSKCSLADTINLPIISPNWETIEKFGFKSLQDALSFHCGTKNIPCSISGCDGRLTVSQRLNHHIFIELDIRDTSNRKKTKTCTLKDLPVFMELGDTNYRYEHHY